MPPGPRLPRVLQTLGFLIAPPRFIEACHRRYGDAVTFSTLFDSRFVMVFEQDLVKQVFRAPPDQLRERVRQLKANGADLIKIFASESIRTGGAPTMSQEQLDAVCGEAKAQGLRTLVHAHAAEAVIRVVKAGCTQVEHGACGRPRRIRDLTLTPAAPSLSCAATEHR